MATKSIETEATEVRAVAKYVRVSPSKARLVVDLTSRFLVHPMHCAVVQR